MGLFERIAAFIMESPTLQGFFFAMATAVLRVCMDDKETRWQRMLLEAAMCGFLTLASAALLGLLNWPENVAIALGGGIGFIGSHQVRALMLRFGKSRAEGAQ